MANKRGIPKMDDTIEKLLEYLNGVRATEIANHAEFTVALTEWLAEKEGSVNVRRALDEYDAKHGGTAMNP
jgi:hypothetical protein